MRYIFNNDNYSREISGAFSVTEGKLNLTMLSAHFIYGHMTSDICLRTWAQIFEAILALRYRTTVL